MVCKSNFFSVKKLVFYMPSLFKHTMKKGKKKFFNPNEDTKYLYVRTHAKENKAMLPSYIAK